MSYQPVLNPQPVVEQQIVGVQDDGSSEGIVRTKVSISDLVKHTIGRDEFYFETNGSAGVGYVTNQPGNYDGSNTIIQLFLPKISSSTDNNSCFMSFSVKGRAVGIRYQLNSVTAQDIRSPFSVSIDGVVYGVDDLQSKAHSLNLPVAAKLKDRFVFLVTDLPDIEHDVRIILNGNTRQANNVYIYGYLAEKRYGYEPTVHYDMLYTDVVNSSNTVPATATALPTNMIDARSITYEVSAIKSIYYYNTDSVSRTVTITFNGATIWSAVIAAAGTARFEVSSSGSNGVGWNSFLKHQADAAGVVNFMCLARL